jgi:hypothetical protein
VRNNLAGQMAAIMTAHPLPSFAMSPAPADVAVFSKDRRPVLVVEVKGSGMYPTAQSAAGLRQSLMAHDLLPDVPFFMLATPIQIFLWHGDAPPGAYPNYSAAAKPVLDSYGSRHANREKPVRGGALEIVMFSWLSDVASGARGLSPDSEVDRMLLESGLYEQIQGGAADFEVKL